MSAIEVVDDTNIVRLCLKQGCDTSLVCMEVRIMERSVPAIAAAVARTLAELTSPEHLSDLAHAILFHMEISRENVD